MFRQENNLNDMGSLWLQFEVSYLEKLESDFLSAKLTKRSYLMKVNKELKGLVA